MATTGLKGQAKATATNTAGTPACQMVANALRAQIIAGNLPEGTRLSSHRQLATEHKVSIGTVQQAVSKLVDEGVLVTEAKRGLFVAGRDSKERGISKRVLNIGILSANGLDFDQAAFANANILAFISAVQRTVADLGATSKHVNMSPAFEAPITIENALSALCGSGVDAIIFVMPSDFARNSRVVYNATGSRIPVVHILGDAIPTVESCVTYNSRQAAYQAALHLAERGCKSLLYFASTTLPYIEERRLGIAAAVSTLERFGVAVTNRINPATFTDAELAVARLVSGGSLSRAEEMHLIHNAEKIAYHWAVEVLKSGVVFDGVVAANDRQALGFMRAAAERGLQVGRDYAIIGFDNELVAEAYELSSMRPPFEAMGREAVRIAMAHVEGEEERQCSQLYSRLVERASSRLLRETENRERTAGSKG